MDIGIRNDERKLSHIGICTYYRVSGIFRLQLLVFKRSKTLAKHFIFERAEWTLRHQIFALSNSR